MMSVFVCVDASITFLFSKLRKRHLSSHANQARVEERINESMDNKWMRKKKVVKVWWEWI